MSDPIRLLIVDDEGGEVPAGEKGEIVIKSDVVMIGYHNRPAETAEALAGGVLLTTVTDVVGFLAFLGLATWFLL